MTKRKKQNINIKYVYELLGLYCLVWLLAGIFRMAWPFKYRTMIESGSSLLTLYAVNKIIIYSWIFSNLMFPWLIKAKYTRLISADTRSLTAGLTLNGCCMSIICLKCININFPLSALSGSCLLLACLIISYMIGRTSAYPSKCFSHVNADFRYSLLSSIIHALTVALSVSFLAPFWVTGISDESGLICTGAAFALTPVVCILIEKLLDIHSSRIRASFAEEMDKIRSDIEAFDKKVAKAAAEKKAQEEQARREQAAREQAERARKAREQAEKDRRSREKAERDRQSREKAERERRSYYNGSNGDSRTNNSSRNNNRSNNQTGSHNHTSGAHNSASSTSTYFSGITNKTELKRRYRQLCKKLHPDCPDGNAESFRQMQSEYTRLNSRLAS